MKKLLFVIAFLGAAVLPGCLSLVNHPFNYATVYSPAGEIIKEGEIKRYLAGSESIEIEFSDGIIYATGMENVVLISDRDDGYYINQEGEHDT